MASRTLIPPPAAGNAAAAIAASSRPSSIPRQPSILSLTLDEIQNALNEPIKSFGSMNMDEFLRNVWTAEESAAMAVAMQKGGGGGGGVVVNSSNGERPAAGLIRQGGLVLPRAVSRMTVEEVWQDIQHGCSDPATASISGGRKRQRRQPTFGEMTLEDFLTRAGVGREENEASQLPMCSEITNRPNPLQPPSMEAFAAPSLQNAGWFGYAHPNQQLLHQTEGAAALGNTGLTLAVYDGPSDSTRFRPGAIANTLNLSPAISDSPPIPGRRRDTDSLLEKSFERRQRRMIKNRESAARSRARKQAYTVELEAEVTQLKEENARLRKQQALERRLPLGQAPERPIHVLRRTRSTSW